MLPRNHTNHTDKVVHQCEYDCKSLIQKLFLLHSHTYSLITNPRSVFTMSPHVSSHIIFTFSTAFTLITFKPFNFMTGYFDS